MILNTYAIHLDPATYPEPHRFRPERWSGDFEEARANGRKMLFTFGAGRRICPAKSVAENIFFLAMTRWLWAFDTAHARDERGNKIPINIAALRPGIVNRLEPFSIDIKPKSHQKADLIRRTWKETCSSLLDENMQWRTTPEQIEALFNREKDRAR